MPQRSSRPLIVPLSFENFATAATGGIEPFALKGPGYYREYTPCLTFWGPPQSVTDGLGMTKVFRTQTPSWMRYSVSSKTTIRENKQSPPGTMSAAIETHLLTRKYRRTVALERVTLEVPEHAVYALVGANGAGKTTLIRLLMNISQPSAGSASVLGLPSVEVSGPALERM
jgi:ABC-type glutathione transport system ATPase component